MGTTMGTPRPEIPRDAPRLSGPRSKRGCRQRAQALRDDPGAEPSSLAPAPVSCLPRLPACTGDRGGQPWRCRAAEIYTPAEFISSPSRPSEKMSRCPRLLFGVPG